MARRAVTFGSVTARAVAGCRMLSQRRQQQRGPRQERYVGVACARDDLRRYFGTVCLIVCSHDKRGLCGRQRLWGLQAQARVATGHDHHPPRDSRRRCSRRASGSRRRC
eukprot:4695687-Prymnesium_polylepis.2